MLLTASCSLASGILYETATLAGTGVTPEEVRAGIVPAQSVGNTVHGGARFYLDTPTVVEEVGGHFVKLAGSIGGTLYSAIVRLDNATDLPDSRDLSTPDVLGSTVIGFPDLSSDVYGELNLLLEPGWYGVIFGSGRFGANGGGGAPRTNSDLGSPSRFLSVSGLAWGNAVPGIGAGVRYVVRGHAIPEPTSIAIVCCSLAFVSAAGRKRH